MLRTSVAEAMTLKHGEGDWSAIPNAAMVLRQLRASRVLLARRAAQILGTVRLTTALQTLLPSNNFTPVKHALYIFGLAVAPEVQGQGIGRALIDAAKDAARSSRADALWLDAYDHAAGAGPFYEKCGFKRVGTTSHNTVSLLYYEWPTAPKPV
jgi:ribosomal protein S18 acetylase RimI-like enzyme